MSRLCRLKSYKSIGGDGLWAYNEIQALRQQVEQLTKQRDELRKAKDFVAEVAKQTPEKPDYWSSCGQCERNASQAEDAIAKATGEQK